MHLAQEALLEFHKKMKQTIGDPRSPNVQQEQEFRLRLIREELKELVENLEANNVVGVADGLADLIYVLVGSAVTWGIDLASVFDEVHRSNMTKKPDNKRADGKVLKDKDFSPARIEEVLKDAAQFLDTSEDGWWEEPYTVPPPARTVNHEILLYEPSEMVSENIMAAAKDQAKILAMKSVIWGIKKDFVPLLHSEEDHTNGCTDRCVPKIDENYPLQKPEAWKNELPAEMVPALHKTATVIEHEGLKGEWTPYGAWVFDCPCGRRHAVQGKLGSRGGMAKEGKAECICGTAFVVTFGLGNPKITETNIEELRKDSKGE